MCSFLSEKTDLAFKPTGREFEKFHNCYFVITVQLHKQPGFQAYPWPWRCVDTFQRVWFDDLRKSVSGPRACEPPSMQRLH